MTTVAIYTRLSKDDGTKTSTQRQERDARARRRVSRSFGCR